MSCLSARARHDMRLQPPCRSQSPCRPVKRKAAGHHNDSRNALVRQLPCLSVSRPSAALRDGTAPQDGYCANLDPGAYVSFRIPACVQDQGQLRQQ